MKMSIKLTKANKIHIAVIFVFIAYLSLANFIFDKLLLVEGESKQQKVELKKATNDDIVYCVDNIVESQIKWKDCIQIEGWGFIREKDNVNTKTYVVLRSEDNAYAFDVVSRYRPDVRRQFASILNQDAIGFGASISKNIIKDGRYDVGLYIDNGDDKALAFNDAVYLTKKDDNIFLRFVSNVKNIKLPEENKHIIYALDKIQDVSEKGEIFTEIVGWAFNDIQSSEDERAYLVLKSDKKTYIFDTMPQKRPDVATAYANYLFKLDKPGFAASIPKEGIENGKYEIGIYIESNGSSYLEYTGQELAI
ncbi:hypothetical protein Psch_03376 [Pelotomaculum schinkii]|uniref:Uncharacterized protein n=1 Tax=Pelotomaculum schinkii TaxID=78350 RepID=A0A4Y7R6P3_9FIRM|nr:hypothetical protein [Pelotomaculum schinkii]TEB04615.1 hypothetical protein Psch_03376 [Pelotomaculum schinkii]